MSICRTTIVELNSEEDTDALIADYNQNFDSMFPECEQTLNSKVGPTTVVSNSVYVDQEAIEKTGSGSRQKFLDKHIQIPLLPTFFHDLSNDLAHPNKLLL